MAAAAAQRIDLTVNPLSDKAEYENWIFQLRGSLTALDILAQVDNMIGAADDAASLAIAAAMNAANTRKYLTASAKVTSALKGEALALVRARNITDLGLVLRELGREFGGRTQAERGDQLAKFHTEKYTPGKKTLTIWISDKYAVTLRFPEVFPAVPAGNNSVQNIAMVQCLTSLLPNWFGPIVNQIRAEAVFPEWRAVAERLKDFDRTHNKKNSDESAAGAAFSGKGLGKGFGKGFGNGGYGPGPGPGKGGGKGKKGKGKGKGVRRASLNQNSGAPNHHNLQCRSCRRWGHIARNCPWKGGNYNSGKGQQGGTYVYKAFSDFTDEDWAEMAQGEEYMDFPEEE